MPVQELQEQMKVDPELLKILEGESAWGECETLGMWWRLIYIKRIQR